MPSKPLRELAALYGVQTAYTDNEGRRRSASRDALVAVLRALGAPLQTEADAAGLARAAWLSRWRTPLEPVTVLGRGRHVVRVRLPASVQRLSCRLVCEGDRSYEWGERTRNLNVASAQRVERRMYKEYELELPEKLAAGYHTLEVEANGEVQSARLIAGGHRAYADGVAGREWGVFIPTYAMHSARSWGGGDFTDLGRLHDWLATQGGTVVGTLPMLAAYLDRPFEPSPYVPVSRVFWNEMYVDVESVAESERCPALSSMLRSSRVQRELQRIRSDAFVDYRAQYALKREALAHLASAFFDGADSPRRAALRDLVQDNPDVESYARFRAATEKKGQVWHEWPARMRDGRIVRGDYDDSVRDYHLYAQLVARDQIDRLSRRLDDHDTGLYLDLPLGVHPDGFDVWRNPELFMRGLSVGAPPDPFFSKGQNWGFPPTHPQASRAGGHAYFTRVLRHHMRVAGVLRIDHVMGFHRLYCIPDGAPATEGVYVRYPHRELYAIAALESRRARTRLVGEDLGTVPAGVRRAMARHGVRRMYVAQFEARPDKRRPLPEPPPESIASVNTHDMPTFHAFWNGTDIDERLSSGLLDRDGAKREHARRERTRRSLTAMLERGGFVPSREGDDVLEGLLAALSAGPAEVVLINLEDLWREPRPQNVPGTGAETPNWRRKARHPLERITRMRRVATALRRVHHNRG